MCPGQAEEEGHIESTLSFSVVYMPPKRIQNQALRRLIVELDARALQVGLLGIMAVS